MLLTLSSTARIPKLMAASDTGTYNLDAKNLKHVTLNFRPSPKARMKTLTGLRRTILMARITACQYHQQAIIRTG